MATATTTELRTAAQTKTPAELQAMKPKDLIAYHLERRKGEIAAMLPKHLTADRLLKVAQIAATTTPALLKCDVPSLVTAIGACAVLGLEPNTPLGHAYLVPFNTKRRDADGNERWVNSVQVIVGYKGLIDLARRSGQIISISAHEVCEKDQFELVYGIEERLTHKPALSERGGVIGFYAVAHLKGGGHAFEFMSMEQVLQIRDGSQGYQQAVKYKKEASSPWGAHLIEMGRKTAIRRLAKYLPLSIEFQTAATLDERATVGQEQDLNIIDGDFAFVDGDGDGATGGEDAGGNTEGGDQGAGGQQDDPAKSGKQRGDWTPTPEEAEAIKKRELAEAQQAEPKPVQQRGRRAAGGVGNVE